MIALCISAGALTATLNIQAFTLAWMHSVEKIRWEEDWRIENKMLHITEARVVGTGAGMEPPLGSVFKDGSWHYAPSMKPLPSVSLMHSPYTKGYEICFNGKCHLLAEFLPHLPPTTAIKLEACER